MWPSCDLLAPYLDFGDSLVQVEAGLNVACVHTTSRAVDLARAAIAIAAVEVSISYQQERDQFGRPGGTGDTTERQVDRHSSDARLTTIFDSQIQQRIISNLLLPRPTHR